MVEILGPVAVPPGVPVPPVPPRTPRVDAGRSGPAPGRPGPHAGRRRTRVQVPRLRHGVLVVLVLVPPEVPPLTAGGLVEVVQVMVLPLDVVVARDVL